jgi:hypothetical protein
VVECFVCQQNKVETVNTLVLLQPLNIPCQHWEEVSIDFITSLPNSEGKNCIMVIFDRLTKHANFCALSHPFRTSIVSATFVDIFHKPHGNLNITVSHRDPIFTGKILIELFSSLGTQLAHSSSYHPQFDGQTKLVNKCLEGYVHCFASDKK